MIDMFKFSDDYWFPHMKPRDVEIWKRFKAKFKDAYDEVQYDFHVGDPPSFNTFYDDDTDHNQDALYRLKIDVIGHKDGKKDIIEVKPDAGASTIGQIKAYKVLYERDIEQNANCGMVIITDKAKPNMEYLCTLEGVRLIVV